MSNAPTIYVLDANVFMEAHRRYYAFDLCPGFWDCLLHYHGAGQIFSIDRIRDEISVGDALETWVRSTAPASMFAATGNSVVSSRFAGMMSWVQGQAQFKPEAKAEFAQVADGWLAAYAAAHPHHVVVTHEEFRLDAKKRVPLPNVCQHFKVPYTDTFTMLKNLQARFRWP